MSIRISKASFQPLELIEGTIMLNLNKSIEARGVSVELTSYESRKHGGPRRMGGGSYTSKKVWNTQILDSERKYPAKQVLSYPFQFTAPSLSDPMDPLVDLWRRLTRDKSPKESGKKDLWIEGKLDIPNALDITAMEGIKIQYES